MRRRGFTLIELLLAIALLGLVSASVALVLSVGFESWRAGTEMAEESSEGDAVMEQIVAALRSAHYPANGEPDYEYGFQHEDDGEEADARDSFSWVKIGSALIGEDVPWAGSSHRVRLFVSDDEEGQGPGLYVSAWQLVGQPEDFEPEEDVVPVLLSDRVIGLDCRMHDPDKADEVGEPYEWIDDWELSNRVPTHVLVTLALRPQNGGREPDVFVRMVDIPMSEVSWNPSKAGGGRGEGRGGRDGGRDGERRGPGRGPGRGGSPEGGRGDGSAAPSGRGPSGFRGPRGQAPSSGGHGPRGGGSSGSGSMSVSIEGAGVGRRGGSR